MMGMIEAPQGRADRRPGQRPGACGGRRIAAGGPPDRHRDAAAADRRRRDHPPHAVRRDRAAAAAPRSASASGQATSALLPNAIEEMLRWTSPVKNMARTITADTEFHGTQLHTGREDHPAVRVGELRREGVRATRRASTSSATRTATSRSASARTSVSATSWPASSCRSCRRGCCSACRICGWRLQMRAAVAAGELRVRPGEDAGGVHADRAALPDPATPSVNSLRKIALETRSSFTLGAPRPPPRSQDAARRVFGRDADGDPAEIGVSAS